jgi:pyridoxal phosphate enzyme (YggS family)
MPVDVENYWRIKNELGEAVTLVAVSKTKSIEDILELYNLGHRDFGENYVQELVDKEAVLPKDIRWHFIGTLQTNKVKKIAPFIHLIHAVESLSLLKKIDKHGNKWNRIIDCLFQLHIADEETKHGMYENEVEAALHQLSSGEMPNVRINGLMGMATLTLDLNKIRNEFNYLKKVYVKNSQPVTNYSNFTLLSMGMSSDYKIAVEEGSNLVRIGSLIFGERNNPLV